MKKTLLLILFTVVSFAMHAQVLPTREVPFGAFGRDSHLPVLSHGNSHLGMKKAGMRKANLADNERILGLYVTDEYNAESGGGLNGLNGTFSLLSVIPASYYEKMADGKITALRFALTQPCAVPRVFVSSVTYEGSVQQIAEARVVQSRCPAGWTTVQFDSPVSLPKDMYGIAIGYDYVQTPGSFPISLVDNYAEESFLLYGDLGEGAGFYDFSANGMLSVQAIVQCDNLPQMDVVLSQMVLSNTTAMAGSDIQYVFNMYNYGTQQVNSYEIQVKIDDRLVQTITEKDIAITGTPSYCGSTITLPADISRGNHILSAQLVKVNGAAPAGDTTDDRVEASFSTYQPTDEVARQKYLIEELTSHSCTYCPLGAAVLEKMQELNGDLAVACIHGNQSSKDPFNTPECQQLLNYLGCNSFPSATFNRLFLSTEEGIAQGIGFNAQYQLEVAKSFLESLQQFSVPAFASVNIEPKLLGNDLTITVSGKGGEVASSLLSDYSLTVYVIEDSLVYRQLNSGIWVANYLHNHVLRKVATAINGDDINWTSPSAYENTMTVSLDPAWVKEQISVIAFISKRQPLDNVDWTDMAVSNANVISLVERSQGGSDTVNPDEGKIDAGLLVSPITLDTQIMGEGMSFNAQYVAGQNFAGAMPCIWNTQTGAVVNFSQFEEGTLHAVSNNGLAVGISSNNDGRAVLCNVDGTTTILPDNGGEKTQGSDAWAVSSDGSVAAGFYYYFDWLDEAQTSGFFATYPCVWKDGKCTNLAYPGARELGFSVDGAAVRWMSADGKRLLGYLVDDMATWPAVVWDLNEQGIYECNPICKNYFEVGYHQGKPYMVFTPRALSPNGDWVSLQVQEEYDDWDFSIAPPTIKTARYCISQNRLEVLDMGDQPMDGVGIANDGTMLAYTAIDGLYGRQGYLWPAASQKAVCLDDLLSTVKGMPPFGANVPCNITADGTTVQGFGIDEDTNIFSYVIDIRNLGLDIQSVPQDSRATNSIYSLSGQRVSRMAQPGIYIVNGKKVMVK